MRVQVPRPRARNAIDGGAPREETAAIYKMVGAHGLQAVRGAQRGALGEAHPAMNAIWHEVVEWKVFGYDR